MPAREPVQHMLRRRLPEPEYTRDLPPPLYDIIGCLRETYPLFPGGRAAIPFRTVDPVTGQRHRARANNVRDRCLPPEFVRVEVNGQVRVPRGIPAVVDPVDGAAELATCRQPARQARAGPRPTLLL